MASSTHTMQANMADVQRHLQEAFVHHALHNRGFLKSARRAGVVVNRLSELLQAYLAGTANESAVATTATALAEQGLVLETGAQLMQALNQVSWSLNGSMGETAVPATVSQFQITFLAKLAQAHQELTINTREQTQRALQQALNDQIGQQRHNQQVQDQRTETLRQVVTLSTSLAEINEESKLLHEAVRGLQHTLRLEFVTLCLYDEPLSQWLIKNSTTPEQQAGHALEPHLTQIANNAVAQRDGEYREYHQESRNRNRLFMGVVLPNIEGQTAVMLTHGHSDKTDLANIPILLRAFTQELASLWRTTILFTEIQRRSRELEVVQGRYIDALWNSESARLIARYQESSLHISRGSDEDTHSNGQTTFDLTVSGQPFGHIALPDTLMLPDEDTAFVRELVQEMSNALNNAKLLQSASVNSNQLSVAAEVSRRVTTILDRNLLIEQVVELVRERFGLYYVGLFLVDETGKTAVLRAGTGEAGQIQIERNFHHVVGSSSMIGTAIAHSQALVEQDVSAAQAFQPNPLLPDTRSELALPLRTGERTIGALTVQHTSLGAFPAETVTILQSLADQLAIAIENAGLFTQLESTLEELTSTLGETSNLYDTSRQLNQATDAQAVYQALVTFAGKSNLVDMAMVVVPDPQDGDYLIAPALWGVTRQPYNPADRFLFDKYSFGNYQTQQLLLEDLETNVVISYPVRELLYNNGFRSMALLPIQTENGWLGNLVLCRTQTGPFAAEDLQPFVTLSDQAAIILANRKLLEQTNTLYTINSLLTQAINQAQALTEAVTQVAAYAGVPQCRFVLFNQQQAQATVVATNNPQQQQEEPLTFSLEDDYIYEQLLHVGTPLLLSQTDETLPDSCKMKHLNQFNAFASYIVPAAGQQELLGYMALDAFQGKRPFTNDNIKFAQAVVEQATIQIENHNLYEDALGRAQELVQLNQIGSAIAGSLNLDTLAKTVHEQIGTLLHNNIFVLAQYDNDTQTYQPIYSIANGHRLLLGSEKVAADSLLHNVIHSNQPILTRQKTGQYLPHLSKELSVLPQSGLWAALTQESKPTGFISLQSYDPYAYSENSAQLLRTIATQTSLAIANAQLFNTAQNSLEEVQQANAKLRELDELKTQFLANMSHELRTPLNSIIGFSRVILKGIDGPLTEAQEDDLNTIYKNGQHLLSLINEILDMAKIEAGKMTLAFEQIDLSEIARTVHSITLGLIQESNIHLIWNIEPRLPSIEADPIRIRQILINLLSNAVKFTEEGEVELRINQENDYIHIAVRDTGIGIAEENYERLFAAFEQVDSSTTRVAGGTGLGLPITKWLINMHGGTIEVESVLNQGTTFHVRLPIKRTTPSPDLPDFNTYPN